MAHICNPNYSGDRDQEDCSSKPAPDTVCDTLSQKYPTQKRAGGVVQEVEHLPSTLEGLEFKPQDCQKKTKSFTWEKEGDKRK
jgi:hypothetical protein